MDFLLDIFVQKKKNLKKNPKEIQIFLCSKNGKKYPKNFPEKNKKKISKKNIRIFLDERSYWHSLS